MSSLSRWMVKNGKLVVQWKDNSISQLPFTWLLDHQAANWHASSNQKINPASIWTKRDVSNYKISNLVLDTNGRELTIHWNGKVETKHKVAEFKTRTTIHSRWGLPDKIPWKTLPATLPQSSFKGDPKSTIEKALSDLAIHGVHLMTDMPNTAEETEKLIRKAFGPPRETFYGGMWDTAPRKDQINDTAYTYDALDPHTDTCYLLDSPGLQCFNCVAQDSGAGGKTRLVDADMVVLTLKAKHPDVFEFFRNVPLVFHHTEKGLFARVCAPVITLEFDSSLKQFRYNEYDLAPLDYLSNENLDEFYEYNKILVEVIKDCEQTLKLQVGQMLVIDNHRVMHGRTAFKGYRNLIGAYVGADDWIMRARSIFAGQYGVTHGSETFEDGDWSAVQVH